MSTFMFNERYGLQQAVFDRIKTDTRRIEKSLSVLPTELGEGEYLLPHQEENGKFIVRKYWQGALLDTYTIVPRFKVGDVVPIAQRYKELGYTGFVVEKGKPVPVEQSKGWSNKMFVKEELMQKHVEITNVRLQRLQDISEEDCLKEGIQEYFPYIDRNPNDKVRTFQYMKDGKIRHRISPATKCFAFLIDDINGKGTWESNPWVVAYSFKLVD